MEILRLYTWGRLVSYAAMAFTLVAVFYLCEKVVLRQGLHPVVAVIAADAVGPRGGVGERLVRIVFQQGFNGGPSVGREVLPGDRGNDPVPFLAPCESKSGGEQRGQENDEFSEG